MPDFFPPLTSTHWVSILSSVQVWIFSFPKMKTFRNCGSHEYLMCSYKKIWPQRETYPPSQLATFSRLYIHISNLCSCSRYQNRGWLCSAIILALPEMIYCMMNVQMPPPPGSLPQSITSSIHQRIRLARTNLSIFCSSITLFLYFSSSGCNRLPSILEAPGGQTSWLFPLLT